MKEKIVAQSQNKLNKKLLKWAFFNIKENTVFNKKKRSSINSQNKDKLIKKYVSFEVCDKYCIAFGSPCMH